MTLAALPRERYRSVVEIGCSIAVLGAKLAGRADRYLGLDVSPPAVEAASDLAPLHIPEPTRPS
mgnify:CR=1 FL=1